MPIRSLETFRDFPMAITFLSWISNKIIYPIFLNTTSKELVKTMSERNYVVKINTALSNKPYFVKISDPNMSLDRIFQEAILTLQNAGKPLESQQLEQLYKQHQMFNNGRVVEKGMLFKELNKIEQQVGDQLVEIAEIDLVTSHAGGY